MAAIVSLQITPSIDWRLRYGDAPEPSADVTASQAVPNDLDNPTGTAFSLAAATYFSGTQLGLGTYSFIPTNGSLAFVGLAFSAGSISGPAPTIGSVTGKFRWTNGSDANDIRDTNEFSISFIVPSFADTTAPTKVIGVTASRSGANVIIDHYPSSDPHDGVSAGSGIDRYEVVYDGMVVHTADTVAPEPSPEWQAADIGALSIPGASANIVASGFVRSSGWIGQNSGGGGIQGEDAFRAGRYTLISGDFRLSMQVSSITQGSASQYMKFGLMLRDTLNPGSPFIFGQLRNSFQTYLEHRQVSGGSRSTLGSGAAISPGGFIMLERVGNTVNFYAGSGGNDMGLVASVTRADIPQSFYVLLALCGTSETGEAEATYDNFSLTQGAKINHTFSSTSAGPFTVRAVDNEDNVGSVSDGVGVAASISNAGKWPTVIGDYAANYFNFFPGIYIQVNANNTAAQLDAAWNQLMTAGRKTSWRPPGVYCGLSHRVYMRRHYTNEAVRPTDPADWEDPGYNWGPLSEVFQTSAVQNDGAKVILQCFSMATGNSRMPLWLRNAPYNGEHVDSANGIYVLKFHRFTGPDMRGVSSPYPNEGPAVVDEMINLHRAAIGYLEAQGWLDKVAIADCAGELAISTYPNNDATAFRHGYAYYSREVTKLWNAKGIMTNSGGNSNQNGALKTIAWPYYEGDPGHADVNYRKRIAIGQQYPDFKMVTMGSWGSGANRFEGLSGDSQKDRKPLSQADETNGIRQFTTFPVGLTTPWDLAGQTVPQTVAHKIYQISGAPKGANRDSALGQVGDDPSGFFPVHYFSVNMGANFQNLSYFPTVEDYQLAIDTFGPPGTFAFPYFPEGYNP